MGIVSRFARFCIEPVIGNTYTCAIVLISEGAMNLFISAKTFKNNQNRRQRWLKLSLLMGLIGGAIILQLPVVQAQLDTNAARQSTEQQEFFEKKIRPIFVKNCQA